MSASAWSGRASGLPVTRLLLIALTLTLLGGAAAAATYVLAPSRYPVLRVRFSGPFKHVARDQLVAAVGNSVQGNFFRLDLNAIRARVESVPWVYQATIRRRWPQAVEIGFTEQTFVAQWNGKDWLNGDGTAVHLPGPDVPQGLPVLSGPDGTAMQALNEYRRFTAALAPLGLNIAMLDLSPRRTWTLRLDSGLSLLLGHEQAEARLARFVGVYPQTVADKIARIKQVDLRYSNGFSVDWRSAS